MLRRLRGFLFYSKVKHYVYIIVNSNNLYYKGYSVNPEQRLIYHNANKSSYTKNKGPWSFIFIKSFDKKTEALRFEKMIKRQNHKYLDWLIKSDKNEL